MSGLNLTIRQEHKDGAVYLFLEGEIDVYTVPQLRDVMIPLVEQAGQKVMVDLTNVNYIDSTGLGVFIGALKTSHMYEVELELTGVTERIKRLFSITGLDELMKISAVEKGESI